eukprot:jgi/Bigna1/138279/aug1.44_g12987
MAQILHDLVQRARSYSGGGGTEGMGMMGRGGGRGGGFRQKAWCFRRRLHIIRDAGSSSNPRLLLTLGMSDGFRVLEIMEDDTVRCLCSHDENGPVDIVEPLAIRNGNTASEGLPSDKRGGEGSLSSLRFLVTSGNNRSSFPNTCVRIYSLETRGYVHVLRLRSPVLDVQACAKSVAFVVHLNGEVQIFSARNFRFLFTVSCSTSPALGPTFSLGPCWLAFAGGLSKAMVKGGDFEDAPSLPSFATTISNRGTTLSDLTKDVMSGLYSLGNMGGKKIADYLHGRDGDRKGSGVGLKDDHAAGYLTIFDIQTKRTLCTFKAHSHSIAYVAFDSSGSMVVTAGSDGQYLHVWQLLNPSRNQNQCLFTACTPRLIHKIFRGITHAHICSVSFSSDSQMLAISSQHGTTHIYRLDMHQHGISSGTPKISDNVHSKEGRSSGEGVATSTPFHRIRDQTPSSSSLGKEDYVRTALPMISTFHTLAKRPTLAVLTSSQQLIMHDLSKVHDVSDSKDLVQKGKKKQKKWALQVSKRWWLHSLLRDACNRPSMIDGDNDGERRGRFKDGNKQEQQQRQKLMGKMSAKEATAATAAVAHRLSKQQSHQWLSQVEMNTYKSNEVPLWASPQFEMMESTVGISCSSSSSSRSSGSSFGNGSGTRRTSSKTVPSVRNFESTKKAAAASSAKELQNLDYLFWEDLNFQPLAYRKHVSFSGLKVHFSGYEGKPVGEISINGKILEAVESPLLEAMGSPEYSDDDSLKEIVI